MYLIHKTPYDIMCWGHPIKEMGTSYHIKEVLNIEEAA